MGLARVEYLGNPAWLWGVALVVMLGVFALLRVVKTVVNRRMKVVASRTAVHIDDVVAGMFDKTKFVFLLVLAFFAGSSVLDLPGDVSGLMGKLVVLAFLYQAAVWVSTGFTLWVAEYTKRKADLGSPAPSMSGITFIGKLVIWLVLTLLALDNIGVDITALVAGLGIGGIAVALAAQNILGDLFSSLSIVFDKPFEVGDFIIVGEFMGTVEHIGIKSTRVGSLSGEQLVFSNADLVNSRIRNYKRMNERRVVFSIGVVYQTPSGKLEGIPVIIREIIDGLDRARFDRAHLKEFGDFSLNFEIVYYVTVSDYNKYMDIQQSINLALYRRFEKEGIEFAYPTQTLFVNREGEAS